VAPEQLAQRFARSFPRGTVLFREGEPGRDMFVVQQGKVVISKRVGTVEKVLSALGPGEFLGEMSILNAQPRSATATCAEDSRLLVIDGATFESMVRGSPEIAVRLVRTLAGRLRDADRQIESLLLRDARARVVHFLGDAAGREAGASRPGAPVGAEGVRLALGAEEIAGRLGLEPAKVRDVLESLERARLVESRDGALLVRDAGRLRHFLDFLQLQEPEEGSP
jgi:CRP/FNR family cyclic AMP-dependent transcriptional regulator